MKLSSRKCPPKGMLINDNTYLDDVQFQQNRIDDYSGYVSVMMASSSDGERLFTDKMINSIANIAYGDKFTKVDEIPISVTSVGNRDVIVSSYRVLFSSGKAKDFYNTLKKSDYAKYIKLVKNGDGMAEQLIKIENWRLKNDFYEPIGNGTEKSFAKSCGIEKSLDIIRSVGKKLRSKTSRITDSVKGFSSKYGSTITMVGGITPFILAAVLPDSFDNWLFEKDLYIETHTGMYIIGASMFMAGYYKWL
mgnify:FL=1